MSLIKGRGLYRIPRVLGVESRGPDELDTAAPIQRVLDVSRIAELGAIETGAGAGGYFQVGFDNVHVGADTMEQTVDVYPALSESWGFLQDRWCWLIDAQVVGPSAGVYSSAVLSLFVPQLGGAFAPRDWLIADWGVVVTTSVVFHDMSGNSFVVGRARTLHTELPFIIPPPSSGGSLGFRSTSGAAGTIRFQSVCWVGPIGVYPPGMM